MPRLSPSIFTSHIYKCISATYATFNRTHTSEDTFNKFVSS
jgi:hypothetical protein